MCSNSGSGTSVSLKLSDLVQPHIEALAQRIHHSCSLAVLDGQSIVYVLRVPVQRLMTVSLSVGSRLPAYCASLGRVLASGLSDSDLQTWLEQCQPARQTPHTVVDRRRLHRLIESARTESHAYVEQELELGLCSMAVPVRDREKRVVAALNASMPYHADARRLARGKSAARAAHHGRGDRREPARAHVAAGLTLTGAHAMARKTLRRDAGTVVVLEHHSKILADNPLGDPSLRKLAVWLPREYDLRAGSGPGRRFPVLVDMVGFTGSGLAHLNWKPFSENVGERAARLVRDGKMGPVIIVFPDCFTALGGNQYVNSSAIGHYADYLLQEIVPTVDREFRTLASREHRGCFGKSSGGYGAIIHGMKYARHWGAIADHSGDAYFDFIYRADWPNTLDELAKYRRPARKAGPLHPPAQTVAERGLGAGLDDGRVRRFLDALWKKHKLSGAEVNAIMNVCMAATYDPDPRAPLGFRLPFHLDTGELIESRWRNWLEHDPVLLVKRHARDLRKLAGIYVDCGWRDQYHIHFGCRQLSRELGAARIAHRYEEFDDDHSDVDYRMDVSLPFLYRALKP